MPSLVVGYDGSSCAHRALDEAARLAKDLGDEVVIVFGYDPGSIEAPEGAAEHREVVREFGEQVTGEATRAGRRPRHRRRGRADPAAAGGLPSSTRRSRHDARAIVVGSYGESPLKGAILGSTPHKLLHLSPSSRCSWSPPRRGRVPR